MKPDQSHLDPKPFAEGRHTPWQVFSYSDADGQPVGAVARFEEGTLKADDKSFRQWRYDPDAKGVNALGYTPKMTRADGEKVVLPLYRLPEIIDALRMNPAQTIYFVEGEKCADALAGRGLQATTLAGGAPSSKRDDLAEVLEPLHVAEVVVFTDCDDKGRKHAERIAAALHGIAASVRLADIAPERDDGFDVADMLDAGCSGQELDAIIANAPAWEPPVPTEESPDGDKQIPTIPIPRLSRLSEIEAKPVQWLWPGRIARGKLTLIFGDPGQGKSTATIDIAARVTRGATWPDGSGNAAPGSVVMLSAEDDAADTIRPRFDAAEADVSRVILLDGTRWGTKDQPFNLATDLLALEAAVSECDPPCTLVVIDPVTAYLQGADGNDNIGIRTILAPLATLAARLGVAIVMVTHGRKGEGRAMYRALGSIGFIAAARAAFCVAKESGESNRRLFLPVKNNIGPDGEGLAFTLDGNPRKVVWDSGPVKISADDALNQPMERGQGKLDDAIEWLREFLRLGALPQRQVEKAAREEGISSATLRRAREALGVESKKSGGSGEGWVWELP